MVYKIKMTGGAMVEVSEYRVIEYFDELHPGSCDDQHKRLGVAYLEFPTNMFWTGDFWLDTEGRLRVCLTDVEEIATRSNLCESDEPWVTKVVNPCERRVNWSYDRYDEMRERCKKLLEERYEKCC